MQYLMVSLLLAALTATSGLAAAPGEPGQDLTGQVMVHDAWARASAGAASMAAVYLALTGGAQPDRLTGVSTPVAAMAGVHESTANGGVMRMRAVNALPIFPNKTVTLAPGGYHIMLMELSHPLVAGQTFPMTVTFEHAAPVTVEVRVLAIGAGATAGPDHMPMK